MLHKKAKVLSTLLFYTMYGRGFLVFSFLTKRKKNLFQVMCTIRAVQNFRWENIKIIWRMMAWVSQMLNSQSYTTWQRFLNLCQVMYSIYHGYQPILTKSKRNKDNLKKLMHDIECTLKKMLQIRFFTIGLKEVTTFAIRKNGLFLRINLLWVKLGCIDSL